jgi:hypothetical protein
MLLVLVGFFTLIGAFAPDPLPIEGDYAANFNVLSNIERAIVPWVQGRSIDGWWSNQEIYLVSAGELNDPGLYSLGLEGEQRQYRSDNS